MKNKVFILFAVLFLTVNGFSQTDEKTQLLALNTKVIEAYKAQKLDEALKAAKLAVELSIKIYGAQNTETAVAYVNLGVIQREKGKYGDSTQSLQNALDIYLTAKSQKNEKLAEIYQNLAWSQFLDNKMKLAGENYLKAYELMENRYGKDSVEMFNQSLQMANFYARNNDFEKANQFYLQTYRLTLKHYGKESKQFEMVSDSRLCLVNDTDKNREKLFDEQYNGLFPKSAANSSQYTVVNGKAINLVKPPYPQEAKEKWLSGQVKIKVEIDENGNVTSAKDVCGKGVLGIASEKAARASKFSQTTLNGKPTKVTGVIIYNFAAPTQRIVAMPISRPF